MASTSIQTVPSPITSAFSKPQPKYDVFLSFRGEDTRCTFTDHLYRALEYKRIIAFRDDKELEMGKPISLELLEAIEKSTVAVIIFSKNYASSTWCLEELAKIVECRDRGIILRVLPIFYYVEPTDVRHQKNTFAEAFAKHEKRFEENPTKVQKWKTALTNVASLSGRHLKDGVPEANFIQNIVEWIDLKLNEKRSNDTEDGLVGISSRVEEMISYLDLESTDVHFIGICEKSGMGKTTLARAVFDKILKQFEASSFLENVREESKAHGLKTLQERLLCDIGKGGLRVKDVHKGMQVISDILHNKKVLIVVDDVSERSQLETLVGKRDLFGKGSRIIVTTEDRDLLASYEIKIVYKARGLNEVEALQLFSLNAFHKPHCENDFLEYCNNFVEYAQRIPLVLKVLGSYLYTRTKNEWESALNQLIRAIPHEKTTKKLRIAFDGLGADEKKLFLDIACFFQGEEKNRIADILESYFSGINPIKNLIDKSLITLVVGEKLWMHNLLQQMGWEIVSEASDEAGERSRLWHCDDVLDVLKNNTGTKHIEGMLLRLPPDDEEELNAESFSKMNKLRLLKICKVRLSCLSYLSNELCWLEWHDYPLESLPNSFQPGELVELIMHRSCLQQLPSEFSKLGKLKLIDLSDSQNLTRTPDFTGFSNIERLNFQGCTRLHELHPSVGGLKRLILLNLKYCKCLENLPSELNLESLKTLILSGCSRFKKFPRIGRNMRSLLKLYLDGTAIEELPPTIGRLTGLTLLNLQDCKNLKSFPSDIHSLTSLGILTLSGCKCQPPKAGHLLGLSPIGSSIGATRTFPRLILFLFLSFLAWRYTYLRIPIFATTALSTYCFHNARHPEPGPINLLLSNSFSKLSTLVTLSLSDCNLLALPDDPSCLLSIEYLNLSKNNFICLPDYTSRLSKLKILFLDYCSKLKSLPNVPLSTRLVSVQGCTALENYSNQVVVWTLGVAGFTIITCLGLAEDEDGTIVEVSLLDIHLLWQRYVKDQIHQMEGFCHVLPQNEIPEWFKHQRFGSFGPIPLPSNLFSNKNWKGIALCVIFVVPAHSNDVSPGEDTKYFHEFYCLLDKYGDLIAFKVPKETYVGSFGLWLYISHARFRKHLDGGSCFTPFIGTDSPDIEINMCGARILYKQDMGEFLQNLGQKIVGSPNDLRGELNSHSHSQLSRLYQVDWARNHLSDYIFPQIASPPRWFAYQNGPAIKTQLPADLHDHSRWRPTPVTELLPSNETIQVIAAGTSKSSSQGSLYLGKISSSLECWLKHRPHLQDRYEGPGTFNQCLPQSEIPGWFKSENIARSSSVTIQLPLNLYDNPEWMGFAFCAVFSFQKHPISVHMKDSGFSFIIVCHLKTNLGCMNPLYGISEEDVIISLHQRAFLWVSFIPSGFLSPKWSRCTSVEFSFVSDNSDVSALKCGVDLVYRQKLEFTRIMVQCITSHDGPFTSYERFPFYHPDQFSGSDGSRGTSGHYSYEQFYKTAALDRYNNHSIFDQCILQSEISEWFSHDSLSSDLSPKFDFHPSTLYNFCFPPSKIQDWFSHPNHGHSVTIDLPSNLYHDSNWMGLVLYASFSINGDPNIIFSNLASGKSHFLYCQCQTSMANVDNQKIAFSTNKEEITWLLNLGEFIWICYVPGKPFKNMLRHCSHIEASFESDWLGVIVQNCALQLLYQHDQVQFEQELKYCNKLISENRQLVCKQQEDQKKINEQYHVDKGLQRKIFSNNNIDFEVKIFPRLIEQPETNDETEIQLGQSDLLENQEKVDTSKELTKISGEHLEKGPYDLLQKMDREIIREESEEPGRCITANKLLCKFGEESNYTGKQRQPIEMDAKQKRNYALENIEYEASSTTTSTSSSLSPSSSFDIAAGDEDLSSIGGHRSCSLDLPPFFHNQKSFRFEGTYGEFDFICRSLGLSGIDDFSIPTADWEAHRSKSDLATRLRNNLASSTSTPTPSRLKPAQPVKLDEVRVRVGSVTAGPSQGIKGARPPVLAPPPVAGRSVAVDSTSTWELLKSSAPLEDEVVAPNTTRLGGYAETTSSSSSSSVFSEEEDKKQNENENDIGIVRATNVIPVYSFSPRGKLRRSISSWQKGELLGSGSFGTVYEGYTEDGFFFAVKEVSFLDQGSQGKQSVSYLEQEISLLKQFEHENIVQYLGTEKDGSRIYIFLELVTKGSLASLYQKYRLRDSQVSAYTRQILNGLKYLHDKKVIHRDIKCSNILVDASGSVKLADFGSLAKVTKLNDIKSCIGTPFWMAPEVVNLKNRPYGLAADIWSLGCTVLEMLTRQHPYSPLEGVQALFTIGKGKPPLVPDSLSRDARDFILKCLQVNPNDRPTATQLLDHPFVTRPQNSFGPASPPNSIQL
ncbi:uncharacterized protein LOC126723302 isoform X6 [Quercus robur]|uniref:uncharacterized protein LOC126723302 isoform X6 n=1 Tax=Quercus robur TaxID=38942 RepID=UPI0021622E3B|nr:uncharacterized protein LOC126723302 isoform X6 [Quercus robur]